MAASAIGKPGTKYGPCLDPHCGHSDCRLSRLQAQAKCNECGRTIGYHRNFYVVGSIQDLAHASCLEDRYARQSDGLYPFSNVS